ncbi:MAG: squalene synthase HpnC [Sulfuriflexus sp.]|nr:squalene synthase HpnC [Sulfuriflexus sp.]
MTTVPQNIESAYQVCHETALAHYENFPVASNLLPKHLRRPISAIYAFARTADDYADEGDMDDEQRIAALQSYLEKLESILSGKNASDPVFIALSDTISNFQLSAELFTDLLDAFRQDVHKTRYANFDEVLSYCRRSANPVGRLLLELVKINDSQSLQQSDLVCTALQLINFYQDIGQDYDESNRIYLAQDEMQVANISEQHLAKRLSDTSFKHFMTMQICRADNMLISGYPLCSKIGGRLGLELKLTIHAAHLVAEKMLTENDVFQRPRLNKRDWPKLILRTLFNIKPKALKDCGESAKVPS